MRRLSIFIFAFAIALTGCKDDDNNSSGTPNPPNPNNLSNPFLSGATVQADFTGRITDIEGNGVSNVLVTIGNTFVSSDANGFYQAMNVPVDQDFALLQVTSGTYFEQYRNLKPRADAMNYVDIELIPRNYTAFFDATAGGTVDVQGGGRAIFSPNSFVNENGDPYSGQVVVASTYLNPTDLDLPLYTPGSLAAADADGEPVVMITYGMLGVEMIGASGQPLQLAEGSTATLEFPVQTDQMSHAPESIPLWFFDEATGIWHEEGSATKVGNTYVGEVSHFTFWNCDISFDTAVLSGTLISGETNIPLTDVTVRAVRSTGQYATSYVSGDGYFGGIVPAGEALTLEFYTASCGQVDPFYTMPVPALSEDLDLGEIEVSLTVTELTFEGVLEDCDGNGIGGLLVYIDFDGNGVSTYVSTSSDGSFSFSALCLTDGEVSLNIVDFASATEIDDVTLAYDATAVSSYDFGAVSFCDAVTLEEYFTYEEGDLEFLFPEVMAFDSSSCTDVYGTVQTGASGSISVNFEGPTALGEVLPCAFPNANVFVFLEDQSNYYQGFMSNVVVTITDYEVVGEVYTLLEGTYTADVQVSTVIDGIENAYDSQASGTFRYSE